jgi:hypothetical protein
MFITAITRAPNRTGWVGICPHRGWVLQQSRSLLGVSVGALTLRQVATADRLPAAAMVSPSNANATVATWGWFASATIPGVLVGALTLVW